MNYKASFPARGRIATIALCAIVTLPASACDILMGVNGERPGAKLLANRGGRPAWSADGRAIYYTASGGSLETPYTLNAVDIGNGRTRKIATVMAYNSGGDQVRTTSDPSVVYFALAHRDGSLRYSVYRVPATGGAVDTIGTNAGMPWFGISASGNRLAYAAPKYASDTLEAVSLTGSSAGRRVSIPMLSTRPHVIALSPDGSTVAYGGPYGLHAVSLAGGAHVVLDDGPGSGTSGSIYIAPQVVWENTTPHLLVASAPGDNQAVSIHDVNGYTGAHTLIATIPSAITMSQWSMARSADGQSFAAWVPVRVVDRNIERTVYRFRLYVKTPADNAPRAVLEWEAGESLPWLEFAPDGGHIGLVLHGRLYLVDL